MLQRVDVGSLIDPCSLPVAIDGAATQVDNLLDIGSLGYGIDQILGRSDVSICIGRLSCYLETRGSNADDQSSLTFEEGMYRWEVIPFH